MKVEDVKNIINFAEINKYEAKVRDISYVVLENAFGNSQLAYKVIFKEDTSASDKKIKEYDSSEMIQCIRGYMHTEKLILTSEELDEINGKKRLSAEDNKEGMIRIISLIEETMAEGKMSKKDGIAKLIDLRTKLQDKFGIEDSGKDTHVIVLNKYNAICPYCNHEVSLKPKEEDE